MGAREKICNWIRRKEGRKRKYGERKFDSLKRKGACMLEDERRENSPDIGVMTFSFLFQRSISQ